MKKTTLLAAILSFAASCATTRPVNNNLSGKYISGDTIITQSLFNDNTSTISEENIQRILEGNYKLIPQLRVAMINLEASSQLKKAYVNYWNDEQYLKTQQSYMELFAEKFLQSSRVTKLSIIPNILISKSPSFANIREAAVRMQADIVVIYSITGDVYSRYKLFSKSDIKAFATIQLIVLDIRTGLIPFSTIVSKDFISQKKTEELDNAEAVRRIQNDAVLLTINEVGQKISIFLNAK